MSGKQVKQTKILSKRSSCYEISTSTGCPNIKRPPKVSN